MDEWVDIWSEDGKPTGQRILKSEAHSKGIFHPTVHLWIYNNSRKVLLQKRAATKKTFPGKWDVSVAGHITAGDTPIKTAVREAREELGVRIHEDEIEFLGILPSKVRHSPEVLDNEFHHIFSVELNISKEELTLQREEVEEVDWFPLSVINRMEKRDEADIDLVQFDHTYLDLLINHLTSRFE